MFHGMAMRSRDATALTEARPMTTMAKLLVQRQQLLERLQTAGPHERDEIERLLQQIDAALEALDEAGSGISRSDD
jgi:uncharacterized protein YpiB (UPF0302 family)